MNRTTEPQIGHDAPKAEPALLPGDDPSGSAAVTGTGSFAPPDGGTPAGAERSPCEVGAARRRRLIRLVARLIARDMGNSGDNGEQEAC